MKHFLSFLMSIKRFLPALMILLILPGMTLKAQEVTLQAINDAVVDESSPDAVWDGHDSNLDVNGTTDTKVISYIKFDISNFSNRQIENAEFSTRGSGEMTVKLTKAGNDFSRDTTTWNSKPSASGELATKVYVSSSAREPYKNDGKKLVDYINNALLNGETEISFSLQHKEGTEDGISWIGGQGDGSYGPMLNIEFGANQAFYPTDDASAFQTSPEETASDVHSGNLFVEKIAEGDEVVSFVKFELKGYAYKQIGSATFSTRGTASSDKTQTIRLRKTGSNFSRDTTNWNNKPSMSGELATKTYAGSSSRSEYTENGNELVNYINSVLATGSETIAFGLQYKEGDLDALGWIGGMNDGAYGPMLEVIPNNENSTAYGIADAVVDESTPDAIWDDNATNLDVNGTEGNKVISFVKFDISNFKGRVVKTADFSTRGSGSTTVMLSAAGNDFKRDTTTWNKKPSTGDELASKTYNSSSDRRAYTPNDDALVNYINQKLMNGASEISFALQYKEGDEDGISWIGGIGDGAYGPKLDLTFDYSSNMYSIADAVVDESTPDAIFDSEGSKNLFVEG
ncbi:MAG TPA: DNRLRE domain-containing protein, partial [Prolixibacteraceae bacterium]|nr:DNRLRE domain-containing protein [Prolixibacteraceae bacterium]